MTYGQCDACWGSGDTARPWPNVRELESARRDWEDDQCARHLARLTGCDLRLMRDDLATLVGVIEKESRRRKSGFWYARSCEILAAALRRLLGANHGE